MKGVSRRSVHDSEKDAIAFHAAFGVAAAVGIALPGKHLGLRIWGLVIGYHVAIVKVATQRMHRDWLVALQFIFPLSVIMILPDGYLATGLRTLVFPDMGVGQIYGVTSFMSFMWTIPLFASTMVGRGFESRGFGISGCALGAGLSALCLFLGSEEILTRIPIWYATENATKKIGNVALYVIIPEFLIGVLTFLACRLCISRQVPKHLQIFGAFLIMSNYLGNLVLCYMILL